ncbi:MAG: hypothetical protein COB78_13235 [Hyphomicrobiales bacterium]|nr:MAG: hypothetical protein COB78_13235 [Hyphomicrobiales bacterium]
MKIVIFINAAHQHKYVDIVRAATSDISQIKVEYVDVSASGAGISMFIANKRSMFIANKRWTSKLLFAPIYLLRLFIPNHVLVKFTAYYHVFRRKYRPLILKLRLKYTATLRRLRSNSYRFITGPYRRFTSSASYLWFSFGVRKYISERVSLHYINSQVFSKDPDLLVFLEDNAEGLTGLASYQARKRNIPYVILPDYIPNPAEPAQHYSNTLYHLADTISGRLVKYVAPRWVFKFDGKNLLRLPPQVVFNQWLRGQTSIQPWILNAGFAEIILLESKRSLRHYEKLGFLPQKLKIIGGAVEDTLYQVRQDYSSKREDLEKKYNLDPKKPLIICGFPPDQYSASTDNFEFPTYKEMCNNWFGILRKVSQKANVIVVRHPRLDAEIIRPFARGKFEIADENLETILPLADLYVASISTTIRWALALGIPVINYDSYRYDYGDFNSAKGIREVDDIANFEAIINNTLGSTELTRLKGIARDDCENWGNIDGNFSVRLREMLIATEASFNGNTTPTHQLDYDLQKNYEI